MLCQRASHFVHARLHRSGVGDIHFAEERVGGAGVLQFFHHGLTGVLVHVPGGDARAFLRETQSRGAANTAGPSGDDDDFVAKTRIFHESLRAIMSK